MEITTLLFDMDSTLIKVDEYSFSRRYFQLLHSLYFSEIDLREFYSTLTEITKNVMLSKRPKELAIETFMLEMSSKFNQPADLIREKFMTFYQNDYNKLKKYIKPMRGVKKILKKSFELGFEVVIATTPVFPEIAIRKRMKWGKIDNYDYKFITHAENMYYSKPLKEYYEEILSKINKENSECLMIGNEFMGDIVGPSKIGIKTFYCPIPSVNEDYFDTPELKKFSKIQPTFSGKISDLYNLLDNGFSI